MYCVPVSPEVQIFLNNSGLRLSLFINPFLTTASGLGALEIK